MDAQRLGRAVGGAKLPWMAAIALLALLLLPTSGSAAPSYDRALTLTPEKEEGLGPQVVVDSEGTTTAVWYGFAAKTTVVRAMQIESNGDRGPVLELSPPGHNAGYPTLDVDSQGQVTVTWYIVPRNTPDEVHAVRISPNGKVGKIKVLSAPGENAFYPQVATDSAGISTVVWQTQQSSNRIQARRILADDSLGPVVTLDDQAEAGVRDPRIALDSTGQATIAWSRLDGGIGPEGFTNGTIRAVRLGADGTPGPVQLLSSPSLDSFYPQVALDPLGRATVA